MKCSFLLFFECNIILNNNYDNNDNDDIKGNYGKKIMKINIRQMKMEQIKNDD